MPELISKIHQRTAEVVVIGVGYVGLPLAVELAAAGFRVTGLESNPERVRMLNAGQSYIPDVSAALLKKQVERQHLRASSSPEVLAAADAVVVCVPTPLNKTKDPDIQHIVSAAEQIARHQHPGMLIILESTTYPGTTREVLIPKLTEGGYAVGDDVFVAFSPERVDPGNQRYGTRNTPKVIGGATAACLEAATALYGPIIDTLVPVSTPDTAEMVKLLENTFRAVNIGLVNEIAIMSRRLGIDAFEVIRAAATKPFGFMPFFPGPGLGGHCIPVDPLYLSWKLRALKYQARFIELADAINSSMPDHVVARVAEALNEQEKAIKGSSILVYGVAYKANVNDTRESPAIPLLHELKRRGAKLAYIDPWVPELCEEGLQLRSEPEQRSFRDYDLVVIVTDHAQLNRERLVHEARLIVDTRDALRGIPKAGARVYGL